MVVAGRSEQTLVNPAPTLATPAVPAGSRGASTRSRALVRASDRALRARLGAQLAKVSAWVIALGYAVAMLLLARGTGGALLEKLVVDALFWLTWLTAAPVALSAAGTPKDASHASALESLARQRGFPASAVRDASGVAILARITRLALPPAIILALLALALSATLPAALARLALCAGAAGYVLVLALLFGGLGHVAISLAPNRARSWWLAFVFIPHFFRALFPDLPSVPWTLAWLREQLLALGALGA